MSVVEAACVTRVLGCLGSGICASCSNGGGGYADISINPWLVGASVVSLYWLYAPRGGSFYMTSIAIGSK